MFHSLGRTLYKKLNEQYLVTIALSSYGSTKCITYKNICYKDPAAVRNKNQLLQRIAR